MVDLGLISLMLWRKPGLCLETRFATDCIIPFRKDFQINAYTPQSSWKMTTEIFFFTKGAPAGDFVPGKAVAPQCEGTLTKERRVGVSARRLFNSPGENSVRDLSHGPGRDGTHANWVGGENQWKSMRESGLRWNSQDGVD